MRNPGDPIDQWGATVAGAQDLDRFGSGSAGDDRMRF